ncbi:MAG: hypothetical protein K6G75_07050, partial [Lachnospiraceae bacterium]|nr:hypothetical protein [Lachnospiraceae bacterium]
MNTKNKKGIAIVIFAVTFFLSAGVFLASVILTNIYNNTRHVRHYSGTNLFRIEDDETENFSVRIEPRSSTWTKVFDFNNEGLEDHNYQAYTYDIYLSNNTKDEISEYTFKLNFNREVFMLSAWNG